jgi:hypothetical protein
MIWGMGIWGVALDLLAELERHRAGIKAVPTQLEAVAEAAP